MELHIQISAIQTRHFEPLGYIIPSRVIQVRFNAIFIKARTKASYEVQNEININYLQISAIQIRHFEPLYYILPSRGVQVQFVAIFIKVRTKFHMKQKMK